MAGLSSSASSVPILLGDRTHLSTCLPLLLGVQPLQQSILGSGVTHVVLTFNPHHTDSQQCQLSLACRGPDLTCNAQCAISTDASSELML
jgi:hypothetical protein